MSAIFGKISYLTEEEMQKIHDTALKILERVGMKIDHEHACELLKNAGCTVDMEKREVKFPPELVENAVTKMKAQYQARGGDLLSMTVRYSRISFSTWPRKIMRDFSLSTGGFTPFFLDLDGNRRYADITDVKKAIQLADALENIDYMGLPVSAQEIPHKLRPVKMSAELIKNTRKIGGIEAWTREDVQYIVRIAEVAAGGKEALRKNPTLMGYAETRTPLCFDENMIDVYLAYIEEKLPQSVDNMPCAGTTAPASGAGALTMGIAESLGALVLGYAADPEAVLSVDVCPTYADMRTGNFSYAGPDRVALIAATAQLMHDFYGCPSGVHGGKTDSCYPGVQAAIEKTQSMIIPVLAGAYGIGTCGHVENAITFSPLQLVIDNEIAGIFRRTLDGFDVNDDTLALDVIEEVGIGGEFITHPHTLDNYKKEFYLPDLVERLPWQSWEDSKYKDITDKAKERAAELMDKETEKPLSKEQEKEIDEIVKEAEATLG